MNSNKGLIVMSALTDMVSRVHERAVRARADLISSTLGASDKSEPVGNKRLGSIALADVQSLTSREKVGILERSSEALKDLVGLDGIRSMTFKVVDNVNATLNAIRNQALEMGMATEGAIESRPSAGALAREVDSYQPEMKPTRRHRDLDSGMNGPG